jgi:hypothetical protein
MMSDVELFTLKEISDLLGVKYRSLISCKDYFSDLVSGTFDGRHDRYPIEFVEFFEKVFELKQTGYTFELVRQILLQNGYLSHNGRITEKLERQVRTRLAGGGRTTNEEEGGRTRTKEDEGGRTRTKEDEGGRKMMSDEEGGWSRSPEEHGGDRTKTDDDGGEQMREDDDGGGMRMTEDDGGGKIAEDDKGQPGMIEDDAGQVVQTDLLKDQLISELCMLSKEQVDRSVREQIALLSAQLEDFFSELTSRLNASITQFYKAVHELQEGAAAIDQRLRKLEADLDLEDGGEMVFTGLDLEQLQLESPRLTTRPEPKTKSGVVVFPHADLEFVRASIQDGKPDKEAVMQWIQAEKAKEPDVSYKELAERLDRAGIPTLRGQEGWNRGVVRNLAVRGNGNGNDSE